LAPTPGSGGSGHPRRTSSPGEAMDGAAAFEASLTVDWKALLALLPVGRSPAAVSVRERLFKELCVRSDQKADAGASASKGSESTFKGSLSAGHAQTLLRDSLLRSRAVQNVTGEDREVSQLVARAFEVAQQLVPCVSRFGDRFIDMNQFHGLALYVAHFVDLRSHFLLQDSARPEMQSDFARVRAAFSDLVQANGRADDLQDVFFALADRCLAQAVVEDWASGDADASARDVRAACRKRAFQLLQALNNTPSLPNSVPGPFGGHTRCSSPRSSSGRAETPREAPPRPINRFVTTSQLRDRCIATPRAEEPLRPPTYPIAYVRGRDMRPPSSGPWQCAPAVTIAPRPLRLIGGMIASPRV